jgi:hypothetical protein
MWRLLRDDVDQAKFFAWSLDRLLDDLTDAQYVVLVVEHAAF